MRTAFALALGALLAAPAAAVTVTGITTAGGNGATIVTQQTGLLEADFEVRSGTPIRLGLAAGDGESAFGFNSAVEIFTALESAQNVRSLSLALTGATFLGLGDVAPGFVGYTMSLNPDLRVLTIQLDRPGEPNAVLLGSLAGANDFTIAFDPGAGPASLTLQATVPEPAAWTTLILGFAVAGAALRRRQGRRLHA